MTKEKIKAQKSIEKKKKEREFNINLISSELRQYFSNDKFSKDECKVFRFKYCKSKTKENIISFLENLYPILDT